MTEQTANDYYIIETNYTWINDPGPKDTIEITIYPARNIWTGAAILNGSAGVKSYSGYDESIVAHGQYETLEAAQDAITDIFGAVRQGATGQAERGCGVVETYWPGEYEILSPAETREVVRDGLLNGGVGLPLITDTEIPEMIGNIIGDYRSDYQTIVDEQACREVIEAIREKQQAGVE